VSGPRRFARLLEDEIDGLEAVNASLTGLTLLHHALYLPELVARFHPDAVVVQINDGELDDLNRWFREDESPEALLGRFRAAEAGAYPARGGLLAVPEALARKSGLATFGYRRLVLLAAKERRRLGGKFRATPVSRPVDPARLAPLVDGLYARLVAAGPPVVFLYIPNMKYGSGGCENKWPDRRRFFSAFAARTGATVVDLSDDFRREYAATGEPLHGFSNSVVGTGHINAAGHRVAASALADGLHEALP
jgi:hypothetical protein